jgi:hypothetical protein
MNNELAAMNLAWQPLKMAPAEPEQDVTSNDASTLSLMHLG